MSNLASKLKNILKNPLAVNSIIMFVGSMTGSFMNYVYNLFMGRLLEPEKYGILAALMSLLYIVNVPSSAITTTIIKYTSQYKGEEKFGKIKYMFRKLSKYFFFAGIVIFTVFAIFENKIAAFLKISDPLLVVMLASLFIASTPATINNGIINGLQKFPFIAGNSIFAAVTKLSIAILLVKLGFGVKGALVGLSLSFFLPYLLTFIPLSKLNKYKEELGIEWGKMAKYALPVFLANLGMGFFTNTDIVLVKRFFTPYEAGIFSALSLTSRTIYFASTSVVTVMFALVAERFAKKTDYKKIFLTSLGFVGLGCALCTAIYSIFPQFVMKFFFGVKYLEASKYLGMFALFISIYAISFLLINYFLSIHKTKVVTVSLLFAGLQAILIFFFHENFKEVIFSSVLSVTLLSGTLIGYYARMSKE
ncbi:hypothetical protein COT51_01495 [candidate division WWE3 bacterium CG08_land_8_20_14_0_20_41_15]|uniref:Polysaccharide biosynthesis protein C-terminal domain-containing protein n=1 Tax=candidate division WWE3 bacterium CG08_land_8_20_14_0_20_41_15 TaxID=1975086 RepID=A0A2H0X9S9_UNCKA|nr:MAG: hypothetical protein COT51_01495 [candidate division WWE3 bacterium CG08_land_8_20_14_0_20_41_15]